MKHGFMLSFLVVSLFGSLVASDNRRLEIQPSLFKFMHDGSSNQDATPLTVATTSPCVAMQGGQTSALTKDLEERSISFFSPGSLFSPIPSYYLDPIDYRKKQLAKRKAQGCSEHESGALEALIAYRKQS